MVRSSTWRVAIIVGTLTLLCLVGFSAYFSYLSWGVFFAAVIPSCIAFLLVLYILKGMTGSINKLTHAARMMADGELNQKVQVTSGEEISELAAALNLMASKLKERLEHITVERDSMATTLSHMSDGIFVLDSNSKVTLVNQAAQRMLQLSEGHVLGYTFIEAVRDYELAEILQRCMKTGKQQTGTVEVNSLKLFLGVIATPLEEDSGCLLILNDLTELQQLQIARHDLASNISHELRTPIASIKAIAETLHEGAIEDSAVAKDFVGKINAEVDKLAQMVQELGELSRIESGEAPFQIQPFDMTEAISQAVGRLTPQADRVGLKLETTSSSTLPKALGDSDLIGHVLVNLIHNAIKFTPPGGKISVSAELENSYILVSIADTGVGIPADDLPRIFERFYKADRARSGSGTGLGLAIAKHIIESHNGSIRVHSMEGKGSTFRFTIPLATEL
ncbi:MAG: ATP-binding protein [Chloroflexota bacterium]|nr:ATP-binding protein [Chloroflexota bacterium]